MGLFSPPQKSSAVRRVFVDPESPQRDAIQEAAEWIRRGRVVAIPTDTLYGLAANPFDRAAVARVFAIKGRQAERALPLVAADIAQIEAHLGPLMPVAARLAARFWPGPLTLLLPAPVALAGEVTGGTGRVGIRVPADPIARAVCAIAAMPVTATSANISGQPATSDPDVVEQTLGDAVDFLLDTGRTPWGPPSTVVDASGGELEIIRIGAIPWDEIQACVQHRG
jgi:L-threonylcarbamoyladenylate synthase